MSSKKSNQSSHSGATATPTPTATAAEIQLSVRIRPIFVSAGQDVRRPAVDVTSHGEVVVKGEKREEQAGFGYPSHVVKGSDQALAFEALASNLIERVRDGYNCTLMAYGQTGSGKTHTMFGPPGCLTENAVRQAGSSSIPDTWGLFPRAVLTLMQIKHTKISLHASAVEIYHELVFDLLDNKAPLQVGSAKPIGVQVKGQADIGGSGANKRAKNGIHPASCTCHSCFKMQEASKKAAADARIARVQMTTEAKMSKSRSSSTSSSSSLSSTPTVVPAKTESVAESFATIGEKLTPLNNAEDVACFARAIEGTRTANSHLLNDRSSRSHCLVKVHISSRDQSDSKVTESKTREGSGGYSNSNGNSCKSNKSSSSCRVTTLLFVDLAGSERMKRTGAEGSSMMEAQSINSSLSALGRVIKSLGSRGNKHIPYRDAALTMLLRDSFGGKSCTSVVINVAAEPDHAEESICSLRFGERMSVVKNAPTMVADCDTDNADQIKAMLKIATDDLEQMRLNGLGGGFVEGCINSEQTSLTENLRKLEQMQNDVRSCLNQIVEARSVGASVAHLQQKLRICKPQAENLQAIVERQQTIKTLWAAPTPAYRRKAGEVKDLEGRMLVALAMSL